MRRCYITLVIILSFSKLWAGDITFKADKTQVDMKGSNQFIKLSGNALINADETEIRASSIEISGKNNSIIRCSGNVLVHDSKNKIDIHTSNLVFFREDEIILIDSYGDLEDAKNEVVVSAMWIEANLKSGIIKMQLMAKVLKSTDKGPMLCRSNNLKYDRDNKKLILSGSAKVEWNGDNYRSEYINVNLETQEIQMSGNIEGVINAK